MEERWEEIKEFPEYAISTFAEIVNMKRGGTIVHPRPNQYGILRVGLISNGRQLTRSLALLVARTFVYQPMELFDTPIHLDGDHRNCHADNLMWRTRSFAIMYHKQFMLDQFHDDQMPLYDIDGGVYYKNMKEVCTTLGVYWYDVIASCMNGTRVPMIGHRFKNDI